MSCGRTPWPEDNTRERRKDVRPRALPREHPQTCGAQLGSVYDALGCGACLEPAVPWVLQKHPWRFAQKFPDDGKRAVGFPGAQGSGKRKPARQGRQLSLRLLSMGVKNRPGPRGPAGRPVRASARSRSVLPLSLSAPSLDFNEQNTHPTYTEVPIASKPF